MATATREAMVERRELLHKKIRELVDTRSKIDLQLSELRGRYHSLDRRIAELDIKICPPAEQGERRHGKTKKPIKLTMDQIRSLADKFGIELE